MKKNSFDFMNKLSSSFCLCIILWFSSIANSYSQEMDKKNNSALKLKAEKATLNKESGVLNFSGNVEIFFKQYKIKSEFLKATRNKNAEDKKISLIEASGNVYISNEKDIVASGDTLTLNVDDQYILIKGNVEFIQGDSVIKGERVYVDLLTENVEFDGSINSYIVN